MTKIYSLLAEQVAGMEMRPNTRRSDLVIQYGAKDGEFVQQAWISHEDDPPAEAHQKTLVPLAALAEIEPSDPEATLRAIAERFEAHPMTGQLPSSIEALGALAGRVEPDRLLRASARALSLGGFAHGLVAAVKDGCAGDELRRYLAWALVVAAGQFDLFAAHDGRARLYLPGGQPRDPITPLPSYAGGKCAGHDGEPYDATVRRYAAQARSYLTRVALTVDEALAEATPEWFTRGWSPAAFDPATPWPAALAAYEKDRTFNPGYALVSLFGQPRERVKQIVVPLLTTRVQATSLWSRDTPRTWLVGMLALALAAPDS